MKKFMMIALVAIGFIVMATPESNAGVSIGIGLGFPGVFAVTRTAHMVTIRTVITLTARLIIDRLSITVADTGLTIGRTAAGFIIGTATFAKVLSRVPVRSQRRLSCPNVFGQRSRHARNTGLRPVWRTGFQACVPSRSLAVTGR